MVIRSYRRVFEVDRRIYRVDRWALPVPGGVPLRAVGYFLAAVLLVLVLGRVPGFSEVSAPIRFVVLPLGLAILGVQAAPDGRAAHRFAADWIRLRWGPRGVRARGWRGRARGGADRVARPARGALGCRLPAAAARSGVRAGTGDV